MRSRTEAVYNFILQFKAQHDGLSPTLREIMAATGITSTSLASHHVRRLVTLGLITLHGRKRIMVVGGHWTPPQSEEKERP